MKANELMIGDLLYDKANDYYGEVTGVIDNGEIYIDGVIAYVSDYIPIPITPEILEKNGFVYKESEETCATEEYHIWSLINTSFFLDDDSWWMKEKDGILRLKFGIAKIKFLHELQHVLRLCHIEKTIEL